MQIILTQCLATWKFIKKINRIKLESIKQRRKFDSIGQSLETQILIGKNDLDLKNKIKKIIKLKKFI